MTGDDTTADRTDKHAHPHQEVSNPAFAIVTVSSTRTLETDSGGDALASIVEANEMTVARRELVRDDRAEIAAVVEVLADDEAVETIVLTGGTGLAPEDVTVEAVSPQFDREIPGFGELFRLVSYEEIGARALLSRACAGVVSKTPVFCLPGSKDGASTGMEQLIVPTIGHILGHTKGLS